jgi:hypothetical protein
MTISKTMQRETSAVADTRAVFFILFQFFVRVSASPRLSQFSSVTLFQSSAFDKTQVTVIALYR